LASLQIEEIARAIILGRRRRLWTNICGRWEPHTLEIPGCIALSAILWQGTTARKKNDKTENLRKLLHSA
jgi:hypothetical protein